MPCGSGSSLRSPQRCPAAPGSAATSPFGPPSGATARCLDYPPQRTGDVDSIITIAPGGAILHELYGGFVSLPVVNTAYLLLGPGVADPDLSNNQATAVLGPPLQILFRDDFESGDLSAWSSHSGGGLEVTHEASLQGAQGLEVMAPFRGSAIVRDDSPASESDYHAHFLFDPTGFGQQGPGGRHDLAVLFSGHADSSRASLFHVLLERKAGTLTLYALASVGNGRARASAGVTLSDGRHLLELAWRRSSGPAANDGQLLLRLDGADAAVLSSLDNHAGGGVDSVQLGLSNAAPSLRPGLDGAVLLDAFESWRPN